MKIKASDGIWEGGHGEVQGWEGRDKERGVSWGFLSDLGDSQDDVSLGQSEKRGRRHIDKGPDVL